MSKFFMIELVGTNNSPTNIFVSVTKNGKLCHGTFSEGIQFCNRISAEHFTGHVISMINLFKSKPHTYNVRECEIKETIVVS